MARGKNKVREGVVLSNKMKKTVVVEIERVYRHPLYQKVMRATSNFKVHDELNECKVGDRVEIMECRPLSRDKRWRVVRRLNVDPTA